LKRQRKKSAERLAAQPQIQAVADDTPRLELR
jgi:hypothetical protein